MYLKSLELQGFKSFPDKTQINLSQGMVAIVGPNGSGKSNIADAVRWVLGEQSTKTLRGAKMEDVIFAGTQKRGPVGFAQVSLTIDNSEHILNIDYNEVTITRRYYRSGDSEFYINRNSVRLKDIHELFMDTGLGRDGYSIIGQGRIDEILSVKSEDRREIFEEAAGITKYRYRKEEAERKLNMTEENLVRIRDIISELEGQVLPLKEQSEKAKEFLRYRDELKGIEVSLWLLSLERLKGNLEKAQADYQIAQEQLTQTQQEVEALYRDSELVSDMMHQKDSQIESVRTELSEFETRISEIENKMAVIRTNIKNNEDNIQRIESESKEQINREGGIEAQITTHNARISELLVSEQACADEIERLNVEANALLESSGDLIRRTDALLTRQIGLRELLQNEKVRLSSILSSESEVRKRAQTIVSDLQAKESELLSEEEKAKKLELQLTESEERRDGISNMMSGFRLKAESKEKKVLDLNEKHQALLRKIDVMKGRYRLICDMERDYEGFSRAVKFVMQESEKGRIEGVHGTVAKLIKVEDKLAVAIEIALGSALSYIVTDSQQNAKAAIGLLKSSDTGRATFLPISEIRGTELSDKKVLHEEDVLGLACALVTCDKKYEEIIKSLLGRTVIVQHIDAAMRLSKKYQHRFRIVTLDGQVLNAGGSMTGGSTGKNTGILSRANEIERLSSEIKTGEQELSVLSKKLSEAQREKNEFIYQLNALDGEKREAEDEVLSLSAQLKQHASLLATLNASMTLVYEEQRGIDYRLKEFDSAKAQAEAKISQLEQEEAALLEEEKSLSGGKLELSAKQAQIQNLISEQKTIMAEIQTEKSTLSAALEQLSSLRDSMAGDRKEREKLILELRENVLLLSEKLKNNQSLREEYQKNCAVKKGIIESLQNEKLNLESERVKKNKAAQDKNQDLLNLERERARLESKKTQCEMEERQILDRLWETYELTRHAAENVKVELDSVSKASKRVNELKSAIKALGPINVGAIEEYQKVSQRYEFMSQQRFDLEEAKEELSKIIKEIMQNMSTIFAQQFETINRYFNETFIEMFGGGRAQLELTDKADILNCGIEIKASPPGKTLKTITLLSGGEKAFVAIALYFAILKVRPTPFCILDEIEAALDDVNVTRFAQYLRKLCHTTQFIIITHRRGTMEQSDMLYGVTMQEQGVSKLLALNINDVESKLNFKPN